MYVCVGGGSGWEGIVCVCGGEGEHYVCVCVCGGVHCVCVCGEWEDKVNFSHMI